MESHHIVVKLQTELENGEKATLSYQVLNNKQCLQDTLHGQHNDSDLVSGVYEGGLKIWECSIDLVHYIAKSPHLVRGKRVLELGCGQGLPGICALIFGEASHVTFQDYNIEVVEKATKNAVLLNTNSSGQRVSFMHGAWESLSVEPASYDVILMSETLYNTQYYESLMKVIDLALAQDGIVIIGTKTFYFGLGGGQYEFQQYLTKTKSPFMLEVSLKLNDLKSIERLVLHMSRKQQVDDCVMDQQNDFMLSF